MPRHGLPSGRYGARLPIAVTGLLVIIPALLVAHASTAPGLADTTHPPPPPTYVPTPIGPPPHPPTPTATMPPTAAAPTPTSAATSPAQAALRFSLDAARVAKVKNPGNLRGLTDVRPGSTIWLMMYYTVKSLPRAMTRRTTYTITFHGRMLFQVSYRGRVKPSTDIGRRSRYSVYTIPRSAPYGSYLYRASLAIGKQTRTRSWRFNVATREHETAAAAT